MAASDTRERLAQSRPMAQTILPDHQATTPEQAFRVAAPTLQTAPMLVASPHSGRNYPADLIAASRLSFNALRRSEDSFVDELFAVAPEHGVPLLQADFPRVYCDVNREPWELDPVMFADKLPPWCNTGSARVLAGFGTIARLVSSGEPIYRSKLSFAEAEHRIRTCWQPYHDALIGLIDNTVAAHGTCLLLDAHSMPNLAAETKGASPDFVLGDAFGTSCAHAITQFTERFLRDRGFRVRRNDPYAGGYVTRHYGRPSRQVHVLQIEICRSLYMEETRFEKLARFGEIRDMLGSLTGRLAGAVPALLYGP
jgi:N-formylglutamate amidohydrolase